jgi:hypothetical protein
MHHNATPHAYGCRWLAAAGLALAASAALAAAPALEVREFRWGFDGQVVPERFNLLSVLVANPSGAPFDGTLRLVTAHGLGADYAQPCYVSPGGSRWIQFHPYLGSQVTPWRVTWGRRPAESAEIDEPKLGPPARVFLYDPESLRTPPPGFRAFPDNLLPTTAAAMDGLDSVVLDYAPRWEAARRAALLDWLRLGGTAHILRGADGRDPVFADELSPLNAGAEMTRVGNGRVVRHAATRSELGEKALNEQGFAPPRFELNEATLVWQLSDTIIPPLSRLAQPRHHWWLINALTVAYIVAIGPGVLLLGKRTRDYRHGLLALAGAVACFSFLFSCVGRRGQGEAGAVHSVAYARALAAGRYEVTQWINVFVTRGAYYTLRHEAAHNLYAVPQEFERINGVVVGGKDGRFDVDLPIYSQRSFVHQALLDGPDLDVRAISWPEGDNFQSAQLAVGSGFPPKPLAAWALYRRMLWTLQLKEGRLVAASLGESLDEFFAPEKLRDAGVLGMYTGETPAQPETFRRLAPALIAWGLGDTKVLRHAVARGGPADDSIRIFVCADSPDSFRLRGTAVGEETGCVIYDVELIRPKS